MIQVKINVENWSFQPAKYLSSIVVLPFFSHQLIIILSIISYFLFVMKEKLPDPSHIHIINREDL